MVRVNRSVQARLLLFGNLALMLVFAISYQQQPLYSSNQNTYFLHGLADAGMGLLELDWLAQTADPFPVFSALVSATIKVLGENAFYLLYLPILAIFVYSILGIACHVSDIGDSSAKYLSYFVLLTTLYSGFLVSILSKLPGMTRFTFVVDPDGLLTQGVAGQYILGPVFQPSTFGVFIVLSIYAFLRDRPFVAVVCLAVAATLHSTYLLSAAVLTSAYLVIIFRKERDFRRVLLLAALALVMVIPVLTYNYLRFRPTTSEIANQAQGILVDHRMPHHAIPSNWFSKRTLFQMIVVVLSLCLVRRTRLFPVLLLPSLVAIGLTIVQVITGNRILALLFPWRISVFLVPIASSIILAGMVSTAFQVFGKPVTRVAAILHAALLAAVALLGCWGVRHTVELLNAPRVGLTPSARYVASTVRPDNLYLIPPDMESFRIAAAVPILVDFKSHPYEDSEIVEWFNRISIAQEFFAASPLRACSVLADICASYSITHVLMEIDSSVAECGMLNELYRDADFVVFEVRCH